MSTLSPLAKRCVELSFKHRLSHVSSVLNTVDLIDGIYAEMKEGDIFVLGAGHASLAHFVVLESLGKCDAEEMLLRHGVHSSRDPEHGVMCSNGSLGIAETVAFGMALADKSKTVWLVTSDGSCAEGSVYETMRVMRKRCYNLRVFIVANGYGAYGMITNSDLPVGSHIRYVGWQLPKWLHCQAGHYLILTESQRDELLA